MPGRAARAFDIEKAYRRLESLHAAGKIDAARKIYARLARQRPRNPYALDLFGVLANRYRLFDVAVELLREAVRAEPGNLDMNYHLALALCNLGDFDASARHYAPVMRGAPPSAERCHNYADLLLARGELAGAEEYYRRALEMDPTWLASWNRLAEVLIHTGRHADAIPLLAHCLQREPNRIPALSLLAIALAATGEEQALAELVDLERFIMPLPATAPAGFADLAEFNRRLARHIATHPKLKRELRDISTRGGGQTEGNLLAEDHPLIENFRGMIDTVIQRYIEGLPAMPGHPHCGQVPEAWRLEGWGVVLESGGHQAAHVHFDGWVSCVYYLSLPEAIHADDPAQAGWIQFGQGPRELYGGHAAPTRRLQPQEGLFVMFPSYFWHETIPFTAEAPRICIAFDVIPQDRRRA